jgi:sulfur-oxidizing protein SoxY
MAMPLMPDEPNPYPVSRRDLFAQGTRAAALAVTVLALGSTAAIAKPDEVASEIKKIFGDKPLTPGRIAIDLPTIAENGLVVPLNFKVESPMTEADFVKSVHFFADGNPNPQIASFNFTPMTPRAEAQIRIRLAQTQNIIAIAEMSDGKLYTAKQEVKVTIGGCGG